MPEFRLTIAFLLLMMSLLISLECVTSDQNCRQKITNASGQCVPLTNCPELAKTFQVHNIANFVEDYACGVEYETGNVLVCCPKSIDVTNPTLNEGISNGEENNNHTCGSLRKNRLGAKWPFVVGIGNDIPEKDLISILCNGVLVSEEWVLTDAYCITIHQITHVFLKIGRAKYKDIVKVRVLQRIRPTNFDSLNDLNGVALIKLSAPVQLLSDDVQVACLPPKKGYDPHSTRFVLYIGRIDDGSVAGGYEVTNHWRNRLNFNNCRRSLSIPISLTPDHLCTNGIRACNVALSKPILVGQNGWGGYTILGVGGLYKDRCSSDVTVFTAVSSYLPWIEEIIKPQTNDSILMEVIFNALIYGVRNRSPGILLLCGQRSMPKSDIEWPFVISLGSKNSDGTNFYSHCTGVLIERKWVLTDALCVTGNKIEWAAMGYNKINANATHVRVDSLHFPPYFDSVQQHNSVALVKLAKKIRYSRNIQAGCLKHYASNDTSLQLHALSSGYHFNTSGEAILATRLKSVGRSSESNCRNSLSIPFSTPHDDYICTPNIEACKFISNPPIVMEEDPNTRTFTVVGVGGDNTDFCNGEFMGFVRVKKHWPWILNTIYPELSLEVLLSSPLIPEGNMLKYTNNMSIANSLQKMGEFQNSFQLGSLWEVNLQKIVNDSRKSSIKRLISLVLDTIPQEKLDILPQEKLDIRYAT